MSRWPDCPDGRTDCRLSETRTFSTLLAWTPEYGRDGNLLNQDPNKHYSEIQCSTCKRRWGRVQHRGSTTFTSVKNGY